MAFWCSPTLGSGEGEPRHSAVTTPLTRVNSKAHWGRGLLPGHRLSPGHLCSPAEAMLSPRTICALLLLSMLWVDSAAAGSSFLSPEHQKAQQKKESKKPPAKLQPRAAEGSLPPEDGSQAEGAEEELEIQFNTPFDVGIKLSGAQFQQHGQALGKFLQDILWEEAEDAAADN
ncbi:appetite-regulating hormone isoform X2 [Tupaia chinensis]|uniref:appetite-regulating hormone isoform X2 n=1 Tax=Tupaia chinensis TaxID=246437 RepID=UPI000FFCBF85|nr:appetite-regulating hormone isoform X2 [Tupaia chinensis]